jgi:hypothetical protein
MPVAHSPPGVTTRNVPRLTGGPHSGCRASRTLIPTKCAPRLAELQTNQDVPRLPHSPAAWFLGLRTIAKGQLKASELEPPGLTIR